MTTTAWQGIALVAMVCAMPLLSWGTTSDIPAVTLIGAILVTCGALALTVLRYLNPEKETE